MGRLEHKAGPTIIRELALRLYPTPLESFREAISNALDEGSNKIDVICSNKEIIVEDWGEGIADVEKFRTYGQDTKAGLGGEIIGEKGLGKLALLRLGQNVEFRTNNGEFGIDILMTTEYVDPQYGAVSRFLDHKGTRVIILNPDLVPPTDELADYLKRVFALRIASGREIVVNGVELGSKLDAKEGLLFRLNGGIDATGNLKADKTGKGSVDLYVKHVFIKPMLVDPERAFKGWVNCNALTPTTNRNDVLTENEVYDDFLDHLKQYVAQKFPKREDEDLGREEILLGNELSKLLRSYLKHMNLLPKGSLPFGRGSEQFQDGKLKLIITRKKPRIERPEPREEQELKIRLRTDRPIRRTRRTEFGFQEVWTKEGNEKEPYYFHEPNLIIHNTTNDLYKFAIKSKFSLGPKWLRILPWVARSAVCMNPEYKKWDRDRINAAVDQATRYFLTQKGELS